MFYISKHFTFFIDIEILRYSNNQIAKTFKLKRNTLIGNTAI